MQGFIPRGRSSAKSHEAAITKVLALSSRSAAVESALDRVARSAAFQSSKRAQDFLRYVVEHALAGDLADLKERTIGCSLFGRAPDYDTGADAIVRVTANDVRKRLVRYYAESVDQETMRFDLPPGAYVPEIRLVESTGVESATAPPAVAKPGIWRKAAIAGWSIALLLLAGWSWSAYGMRWAAPGSIVRKLPWTALFDNGRTPQLIMADSSMGILRDFKMFPVSLEAYSYRRFLNPLPGLSSESSESWRLIAEKRLTSNADARIAADFARIAAVSGRTVGVRAARDVQLNDFWRGDNLVLLGSAASNPWVELFQPQLDFDIQLDPASPHQVVQIRHAGAHEPAGPLSSISTGKSGDSYASLALVDGLGGKGHVLIAQGASMEGTDLAGEMAFSNDELGRILSGCGIANPSPKHRFEILFRLSATAGSPRGYEVLAVHCRAAR